MERNRQIAAMCETEDEKMLLIRAYDKLERGMEREVPVSTSFLTPREQALLQKLLPQCGFFGGTAATERNVAYWLPEYLTKEDFFADGVISCIRGSFYEKNALSHRDVLGALMGAGIRRDAVGDIIVHENRFEVFVLSELTRYLLDNLTSAGRHHLSLEQIDPLSVQKPPQKMRELRVSVSSLRFDSVIAAAFHLSRGAASEAIRAGAASLNALICLKPDRSVEEADEISIRGMGKLKILEIHGQTRKDRTALTVGIYL